MSLAFVYAGQGSQKIGMGSDFYEQYPSVRRIFDSKAAGFNIPGVCFAGSLEKLTDTRYTQPCMAAFGAAVTDILFDRGIKPAYVAGLSLGEYSAVYASGMLDSETLLDLVAYRGRIMAETTYGMNTEMAAVIGIDSDLVIDAVGRANVESSGIVACCNFNCKGQVVIGGHAEAVALAVKYCGEKGARRCIKLNVSAPFHTPLMEEASHLMAAKLGGMAVNRMNIPVIFNVTGDLLKEGESVKKHLENQVKYPVMFEKTILRLKELGVTEVIEIGPGNALSGFIKKTAPEIKTSVIEDLKSLNDVINPAAVIA